VALIDIRMPVLDGHSAIEPNVLRALQNRAAGFVLKSCAPDELIARYGRRTAATRTCLPR
jgi:DNA-binding NarL/FixJ family response regulator